MKTAPGVPKAKPTGLLSKTSSTKSPAIAGLFAIKDTGFPPLRKASVVSTKTRAAIGIMNITQKIALELSVKLEQVVAAVALLDEGSTVPFISRYRKEATGGLDDLQLRDLEVRLRYLRELEERREAILASIGEQEKLTPELERQIRAVDTKTELEDLYLPYKPKRRTKAMIAIEAGLEPLADQLYADPTLDPQVLAATFVSEEKGIADIKAALEGAKYILMEKFSEDAALAGK